MIIDLDNFDTAVFYLQTKKMEHANVRDIARFIGVEQGYKETKMLLVKISHAGLGKFVHPEIFGLNYKGKNYKGK